MSHTEQYYLKRQQHLMPGLCPKWVRCYDDDGSVDQFTCVFTGKYTHKTGRQHWWLGMSDNPYHPQGVGQHGESDIQIDVNGWGWAPSMWRKNHLGKRVPFISFPNEVRLCILQTYMYLWDLLPQTEDGILSRSDVLPYN